MKSIEQNGGVKPSYDDYKELIIKERKKTKTVWVLYLITMLILVSAGVYFLHTEGALNLDIIWKNLLK